MTCRRNSFCFGADCLEYENCPEAKPIANQEIDVLMKENRLLKEKLHTKEEELADIKIQLRNMLRWCTAAMPLNQSERGEIATKIQE